MVVLQAFLDESYNADFFSIGAAIAEADDWDAVEDGFHQIIKQAVKDYGISHDAELHGHELMGGSNGWEPLRGKHREIADIYATALRILIDHHVVFIFRGIDVLRLRRRYKYPDPPHKIVLGHILERIDDYGKTQGAGPNSMIAACDEVGTQIEHQADFLSAKLLGTPGYRSSKLERISAPLNFLSSQPVPEIQAADLAVYLYRRRATIPHENHPAAQRTRNRLWEIIAPHIFHEGIWCP